MLLVQLDVSLYFPRAMLVNLKLFQLERVTFLQGADLTQQAASESASTPDRTASQSHGDDVKSTTMSHNNMSINPEELPVGNGQLSK